jgi:hypothetical protein
MTAWRFVLVAEDASSARNVRVIVDAPLEQRLASDWAMDPSQLESQRRWTGLSEHVPFDKLNSVGKGAGFGRGPQVIPQGWAAGPFARQLHAVRILALNLTPAPELVVVAFDQDLHEQRRQVVDQAHTSCPPNELSVALMNPESEAWPIVCFGGPEKVLTAVAKVLGFDPSQEPQSMRSTTPGSNKDCKAILKQLGGNDEQIAGQWMRSSISRIDLPPSSGLPQFIERAREAMSTLIPSAP